MPRWENRKDFDDPDEIRTVDDKDQIEKCLHCQFPECRNCLDWTKGYRPSSLAKPPMQGRSKPVCQYTLDGDFVAEYPTMKDAGAAVGIAPQQISKVATGERRTAGGYRWKLKDLG